MAKLALISTCEHSFQSFYGQQVASVFGWLLEAYVKKEAWVGGGGSFVIGWLQPANTAYR